MAAATSQTEDFKRAKKEQLYHLKNLACPSHIITVDSGWPEKSASKAEMQNENLYDKILLSSTLKPFLQLILESCGSKA